MRISTLRLLNITGLTYKKVVTPPPAYTGGAFLYTQSGLALLTQDDHYILVRGKTLKTQDDRTLLTQSGDALII